MVLRVRLMVLKRCHSLGRSCVRNCDIRDGREERREKRAREKKKLSTLYYILRITRRLFLTDMPNGID